MVYSYITVGIYAILKRGYGPKSCKENSLSIICIVSVEDIKAELIMSVRSWAAIDRKKTNAVLDR